MSDLKRRHVSDGFSLSCEALSKQENASKTSTSSWLRMPMVFKELEDCICQEEYNGLKCALK